MELERNILSREELDVWHSIMFLVFVFKIKKPEKFGQLRL
jgi:hypothetical protein